ncbi:hypothetical protein V5799_033652, partial [Amblyomma americanum]
RRFAELEAVKQLCTARSANAGVFTVLLALLHKRLLFWIRVWWTKPLSVGIIVASMVLLVLCEMHLLPSALPAASSFTYTPKELFDVSYGFIEADNARAYAWFNGQCPYSAMLSLNMLHTALLRNLTGQKGSLITLVNSPFVDKNRIHKMEFERNYGKLMLEPVHSLPMVRQVQCPWRAGHNRLGHEMELFTTRNLITRLLYSFFVSLALSSYAASHVFAPMVEWSSGLKHMQLMTGMSGCLYWMGHFLFDMIMALCNSFLLTFIIFLSHMQITVGYHLAILALFVANAFSSMPLTYLFSGLFRDPTWAFSFLALGLFLAGMVGSIGVEILQVLVQEDPSTTSSPGLVLWGFVFRWFPTYSLVRGVIKVILLFRWNAICLTGGELLEEACQEPHFALDERISRCCEAKAENKTARLLYPLQPFHETGFYEAVSMVIQGTLYLAILSLADAQAFYNLRWYLARRFHGGEESDEAPEQQRGPRLVAVSMDPEVEREGNLVNQVCRTKAFKDVAMVIRNMQKAVGFITPAKVLDGVSILLNRGECLGLVGINNSGKSTLLEVLVGLQVPTGGGAHTAALSLGVDLRAWQQCIGYAPDGISEANMPALTVGELLDLMARLRGVLWRRQAVLGALSLVGRLKEDQMINKCSHGEMKMLLIVAAVMGVPPVVLLDEPYSDVEPLYRNEIIRMVQVLKGAQAMSIIMTSHR